MLVRVTKILSARDRGDTLVEVTIALAILSFVLLGSILVAENAFRIGQTARERTQLSEQAQAQMEALRSFRDNHTWDEFLYGNASLGYSGVFNTAPPFHMITKSISGATQWVPITATMAGSVPTSSLGINLVSSNLVMQCYVDINLDYSFTPLGGGEAKNHIKTRLANVHYAGDSVGCGL